ncbi:Histone H2A [Armadillidium nasatum]|uniref:Histone H2A n=1 Tax=Armadillidium nasatum TaxID=96803 RepID=A0A5N5TCC5_9CRUS|nr:Histone H2A [Armadillidium nasatum]
MVYSFQLVRIHGLLRKGNYAEHAGAPVYLAAVMEYLAAENAVNGILSREYRKLKRNEPIPYETELEEIMN